MDDTKYELWGLFQFDTPEWVLITTYATHRQAAEHGEAAFKVWKVVEKND